MTISKMGALLALDPAAWAKQIREAMRFHAGRVPEAARHIGVSPRQLFRWLARPELVDVPRVEHGLPLEGRKGRPVGSKDLEPRRARRKAKTRPKPPRRAR